MDRSPIFPHFGNASSYHPLIIERADGVNFWDSTGKKYIDGVAGVMVVNAGYGRQSIIDAMKAQIDRLTYNFLSYSISPPALNAARRLIEMLPGRMSKVFYTTGGS